MHLARPLTQKGTHKAGESALGGSQAPGGAFLGLYEPTEATPPADDASGTARQEDRYEASIVVVRSLVVMVVRCGGARWVVKVWRQVGTRGDWCVDKPNG